MQYIQIIMNSKLSPILKPITFQVHSLTISLKDNFLGPFLLPSSNISWYLQIIKKINFTSVSLEGNIYPKS